MRRSEVVDRRGGQEVRRGQAHPSLRKTRRNLRDLLPRHLHTYTAFSSFSLYIEIKMVPRRKCQTDLADRIDIPDVYGALAAREAAHAHSGTAHAQRIRRRGYHLELVDLRQMR